MFKDRRLLAVALFVCLALPEPRQGNAADAPQRKPNVLFIVADDLGYGDLGCYGSREIRTPVLDRLARDGVKLTDAYASAPICSPTRASLITGRYPQRSGFDWVIDYHEKHRGLAVTTTSLPALMKKAGYKTALFGKWHLGYSEQFAPNAHGFEEFFGFLAADLDYYSHKDANGDPGLYENTKLTTQKGYLTDLITERSQAFVSKHAKQPWFLTVSYNAPHWPFQPPNKPTDIRGPRTYGPATGTRADYVRMVEHLDTSIGKLLATVTKLGLDKDTLVVFISDNGGERLSDNGPLFHGKYTLWEGGIRVPALVRYPGVIPAARVSAVPVIFMDLHATALAAAGVKVAGLSLDGEDLLPTLTGKAKPNERTFFWRLQPPGQTLVQKAARRGKWKYVRDNRTELLFDLEKDQGERKNLAYANPDLVQELRQAIYTWEVKMLR